MARGPYPGFPNETSRRPFQAAQVLAAEGAKYGPGRAGRRPKRHLFTGKQLRCSVCGEAMLPRSDPDVYVCRTNKQLKGAGSCPMPNQPRELVDSHFLWLFERTLFDYDATRERVARRLERDLADTTAQLARADRDVASLERQQVRFEEDYLSETLSAARYERLSDRLEEKMGAALAERDRLGERARTVREDHANLDAESETLRRLAALRDAVAARAKEAADRRDIDALRGVMAGAFRTATLSPIGTIMDLTPGGRMKTGGLKPRAIPFETKEREQSTLEPRCHRSWGSSRAPGWG